MIIIWHGKNMVIQKQKNIDGSKKDVVQAETMSLSRIRGLPSNG